MLALSIAGCSVKVPLVSTGAIQDLNRIPQDARAFVKNGGNPIIESPASLSRAFETYWYGPWETEKPQTCTVEEFGWAAASFTSRPVFGPNLLEISSDRLAALVQNAQLAAFPSQRKYAITIRNTAMRALPSAEPVFFDFREAGEGYPFDYNQNSAVWAGTPLLVAHASADGRFVGAESPYTCGWVDSRDIAYVDRRFIEKFRSAPLAAIRKDWLPIADNQGAFLFDGRIGMLLPVLGVEGGDFRLAAPRQGASQQATLAEVRLSAPDVGLAPLPFTEQELASSINEILGQPYGWGGLGGYRDCSSTVLDLFLSLGVALPRNSSRQATAWKNISLADLAMDEKKKRILETARPFRTLLNIPGHILLYLGTFEGEPIAFHTIWGLRTASPDESSVGRHVIGRSVITTLSPGLELDNLSQRGNLFERIDSLTLLGEE
jgi:cell wall-associated NlpC family hydrolase